MTPCLIPVGARLWAMLFRGNGKSKQKHRPQAGSYNM